MSAATKHGLLRAIKWAAGALLLLPIPAQAQTTPYQFLQDVLPYVGLGPTAQPLSPSLGDAGTGVIVLPFDLTLYGQTFSTLYVNANGVVSVAGAQAGLNFPPSVLPAPAAPNGFIAALWDDWCVDVSACPGAVNPGVGVFYEVDATPGQGRVRVEWRRVRRFSDIQRPSDVSFMLTWHEGVASQVELHYGPASAGQDFAGQPSDIQARIGLEDAMGQRGMWLAPCSGPTPCDRQDVSALQNTRIRIFSDAGEDVTMHNVSSPPSGYPGVPLAVRGRLLNRHQAPLGPMRWAAHLLAPSATSTQGSTPLLVSAPTVLQGFESRLLSFALPVPEQLPAGEYRVAMVADAGDQLAESDETNNLGISPHTVRIGGRGPDFRVLGLNPQQNNLRAGQSFEVDYSVENAGNAPGALRLQLYLSSNAVVSTADLPLGSASEFLINAQEQLSGRASLQVPAGVRTGAYHVGAIVDPDARVVELDETNNVGRAQGRLLVASDSLQLLTDTLPVAVVGRDYQVRLQAAGGDGAYRFELVEGRLPAGLRFEEATGTLLGVPLEPASVDLRFDAQSGALQDSKMVRLLVVTPQPPLTVVTRALPECTVGQDYASELYVIGGAEPYEWRVEQGSLPRGLHISAQGEIVGAPRVAGIFPMSLRVRDNAGASAALDLAISVRSPPNLRILTHNLPDAELGQGYFQRLFASGGVEPLGWRAVTVVPAGLIITPEGRVQGSPEQVGEYRVLVRVTDRLGSADSNELTLKVRSAGRFFIVTEALPEAVPEQAYRAILKAQGGAPPYAWQILGVEGQLPEGLMTGPGQPSSLGEDSEDLVISGLLATEGRWAFTAQVTDSRGRSDRRPFAVVARARPSQPSAQTAQGCNCFDRTPRSSEGGMSLIASGLLALAIIRRDRRSSSAENQPREP